MNKSRQTTLPFLKNKENYIIIEEKDETSQTVPPARPNPNNKPISISDDDSSMNFLNVNSKSNQRARSPSPSSYEPKLKDIKLTQSPCKSNYDSDFFDAIDNLEKEYNELQKDEVHQILQNDENTFQVISVKDNNDNLYEYQDMFASFGLVNAQGDLRCKLKVLGLKHQLVKTDRVFVCVLTGTWSETEVDPNDEVQIFGRFCQDFLSILIQNSFDQERNLFNQHFIVVEPSILLPPTTITTALPCNRRGVLSTYIGGRDEVSLPLLKGSMLHNIFEQLAMTSDLAFQPDKLEELVQSYIDSNIESFYILKTDMDSFIREIKASVKDAQQWVLQHFKQQKELEFWNGNANSKMKVLQVVNAEQMMTAHNLGLKGKTDLVLFCEVTTTNKDNTTEIKRCFVPFELKTGEKEVMIYNMQVSLLNSPSKIPKTLVYCVLVMQQHKQYEGVNGILYYMKLKKLVDVKFRNFEVFSIINKRNLLAKHYKKFEKSNNGSCFPPMINNPSECNRCYQNFTCSLINLTLEDSKQKKPLNNNKKRLFPQRTVPDIEDFQVDPAFKQYYEVESNQYISHLFPSSSNIELINGAKKEYLQKWFNLLHLEESYERELYSTNGKDDSTLEMIELENFDELREHVKQNLKQEPPKAIVLKFSKNFEDKDSVHGFLDNFKPMDYVGLTQSSLSCTLRGNVVEKRMKKIKQEDGKKSFLAYICIRCYINEANINPEKFDSMDTNDTQTFWKLENKRKNFFPLMRGNLLELIVNPDYQRLYELIVENRIPQFDEDPEKLKPFELLYKKKRGSNADQINAIQRCLQTKDYNIVLGMPGTGKTYVIVLLIRILLDRGDRIILSSYTHSAIDGILKRFVEKYPTYRDKLLRIASNANQVDESIRDIVYQKKNFKSINALSSYLDSKQLFAVTCLASANVILSNRKFDTCIIDEASQALEPAALGPINLAQKFILFGDHHQLQPLVKSKEAQDRGMQVSLFERLINKNPGAVSTLSFQYRMNEDIMHISNTLIYDNRLKIDNPLILQSSIDIPYVKLIYDKKWLLDILNPERRVIFLNLDCINALRKIIHGSEGPFSRFDSSLPEDFSQESHYSFSNNFALLDEKFNSQMSLTELSQNSQTDDKNKLDLKLAVYLTRMLLNCGVKPEDIAVITPLNSERSYILSKLDKSKVEVFTVDKSQGIDKSCVIINLSLENKGKEFLLTNPRRINVAFTRAKQKLIVIGSIVNLKKMENMNKFIDIIVDKRWVYNMEDYMMEPVEEKRYDELSNHKASVHSKYITQ